jgi:hypothetical protein
MKRKPKRSQGAHHFYLELAKTRRKTGVLFITVDRFSGDIQKVRGQEAAGFWVNGRYDLYSVGYDKGQYTSIYKFFPFGQSGRWELTELTAPLFPPSKAWAYRKGANRNSEARISAGSSVPAG